jgi:hypothetical protein
MLQVRATGMEEGEDEEEGVRKQNRKSGKAAATKQCLL